jgi:probable addiction module antidote protein
MPKTTSYKDWLGQRLSEPERAARYLNAAYRESTPAFLKALRKVAEAFEKKRLADSAGVSRESLYRMLSETGNPTIVSLRGITEALGFRLEVVPLNQEIQENEAFAVPKITRRDRKVRL